MAASSSWRCGDGNNGQVELTGFGEVAKVEEDGGAVIVSIHPRRGDQIIVPSTTAYNYYKSRLNKAGVRLAIGDAVCYVANKSLVAYYVFPAIRGWGKVTHLQRGHGFLTLDDDHSTQVFFPGTSIVDDLWNFHNLVESLRFDDQLEFVCWDQGEYLGKTKKTLKAEVISLPRMTNVSGDAERPDVGFVMQHWRGKNREDQCVLYCKPHGAVLLRKEDVEELSGPWPPVLGTRFIFRTKECAVGDGDDEFMLQACRALPHAFRFKRTTSDVPNPAAAARRSPQSQQTTESFYDSDSMIDEMNDLSNWEQSFATSESNSDRRVTEEKADSKQPDQASTCSGLKVSVQLNCSQKSNGSCVTPPPPPPMPASYTRSEKTTQTEFYPVQLRFINAIVNDAEILDIIINRYTQQFHELIQAQD